MSPALPLCILVLVSCGGAGRRPPAAAAVTERVQLPEPLSPQPPHTLALGPSDAQVRSDLGCPDAEVGWVGGLGMGEQVILRTLVACGTFATYEWSAERGWFLSARQP